MNKGYLKEESQGFWKGMMKIIQNFKSVQTIPDEHVGALSL